MKGFAERIASLSPEKRKILEQRLKEQAINTELPILPHHGTANRFPLSFAQQRLWFLHQLEPDSPAYTIPLAVSIVGPLDTTTLERSLNEVIRRHEVLRASFANVDGQPSQQITPNQPVLLPVVDLELLPATEQALHARQIADDEARRPFDLAHGPLLRCQLVRLSANQHTLVLTLHHIVADGWSVGILVQEISALYAAFLAGKPSPLSPLAIQYVDTAIWQQQQFRDGYLATQLAYWKQQLDGLSALELPTDHPRPAGQTYLGARQALVLAGPLVHALQRLCQQEGLTVFMVLLAAFKILLYRYSGQFDIAVGSPSANRNRRELEGLIGVFVNTLVLRTDLSGNPSCRDLLRRVHRTAIGAYAHANLPFEKLVEELRPERDPNRTPLFQVLFSMQPTQMETMHVADLTLCPAEIASGTAKFDLTMEVSDTSNELKIALEYNTALFEPASVARMLAHYQQIVAAIVADPAQPINTLALLTPSEQQQILREWNATATDYPRDTCLPQLFEAQAAQTPNAWAITFEDERLSYHELNRRANQLAHVLRDLGVGPEAVVGLCLHRSINMVVAALGVLKAGAAYLPLDPSYPPERLSFMIEDAQAPVLLTQTTLVGAVPNGNAVVLCLDTNWHQAAADTNPTGMITPANLAYLMYTSGSLGKPKGVQIPHGALVNFLVSMQQTLSLMPTDRLVAITTLSFDIAALELYLPLISGAELVLAGRDTAADGTLLAALIAKVNATILQATPATWRMLLDSGWGGSQQLTLLCGGEALPHDLANRLLGKGAALWNLYGPTETTIWSAAGLVTSADRTVTIGRPIANTQIYLLDAQLQPVPPGIPGELYIGGDGLARGYFTRPDLTAERFVPDPFGDSSGARLYRTGDLARYLADGQIEVLGRIDHQVKIRGYRIELGEIEATLRHHPQVRQAVVVARANRHAVDDRCLVAYYVPAPEQAPAIHDLRQFLRQALPEYMLPAILVPLAELPLTPNGKLDRRALPVPGAMHQEREQPFVAPRTPTEEVVAGIWSELLGIDQIGIHDHFFELGGHSLLATQLMAHIREAFGVELPLRSLFENPTVIALARAVGQQHTDAIWQTELPTITVEPEQRAVPFPLNEMQQAYWIGRNAAFELGNIATHGYLEIEGSGLDVERLGWAWQQLIMRHDMLRMVVLPDGQQQILAEVPNYQIQAIDLRDELPEIVAIHLDALREQMSHQVMATDTWPLFDLRVTYLDCGRVRLHISFDLLIADAWSFRILLRELTALYVHPATRLPPLELSFRDYVLAETALAKTAMYERCLQRWRERLPELPPGPELPLARQPGALDTPRFVRRSAQLDAATWRSLKARVARAGLTPSGLLLAAYAEVLATWSKGPRFTINVPRFNRLALHPQVNDLVGQFASFTLLEVDHRPHENFLARARRLQEQLWENLNYGYVSGVRLLRELTQARGQMTQGTMPVVFTSAPQPGRAGNSALTDGNANLGDAIYSITQTSQVWLDNQVYEEDYALHIDWDAVDNLFPAGMLDDMFAAYATLLRRLANDDSCWQAAVLDLIPPAQLEQRSKVNTTDTPGSDDLLQLLFLTQAQRQPQQPAIIAECRSLTYAELRNCATHLGWRLRQAGARPNTLVAIVMEKGWEQVAAVLATLQAGAAYLPLDPELPAERLAYLLAHSTINLVLTQPWVSTQIAWPTGVQVIDVTTEAIAAPPLPDLAPLQTADDLAYVIYTSGSTGLPKGAMITQRGVVNAILHTNHHYGIGPADRVLALTALHHDMSVYDIFGLLAAGGTIVIPQSCKRRDPAHWLALIDDMHVTLWNSVPAMMEMLLTYAAGQYEHQLRSLRLTFLGGDWIPLQLPERLRTLSDAQLVSVGGPTETTLWNIWYPIGAIDPDWKSIPYGQPIANTRYYVLNEALQDCPVWVPGQMYCAGVGLARGYWGDVEKTNERFIQHPATGERLYATGDLGRYLPDGNLEFLGRTDFQIKLMGHRIEPGEIEAALCRHPAIDSAIVAAVSEPPAPRRLVAYVVPQRSTPTTSDLGDFLESELSETQQAELVVNQIERIEFKLQQHNLRPSQPTDQRINLASPEPDADLVARYAERRSYRKFAQEPIAFEQLSELLGCLRQIRLAGSPIPKYRYPSGGGLYPVQVYLAVKPDRVAGLSGGVYYYHPGDHQLIKLADDQPINEPLHAPNNQAIIAESALSIFLIGQYRAVTPLYGPHARDLCLLEAGYMGQLLMTTSVEHQIGLCPIGRLDHQRLRQLLGLEANQEFLHGFAAGRITPAQTTPAALVQEATLIAAGARPGAVGNAPIMDAELRAFLRTWLPEHMIPSTFVALDALPLTRNGKVDRCALPALDQAATGAGTGFVAPRTPIEQQLSAIWHELLVIERIGIYDNFLEIGGHSLLAIQLIARIRDAFEVELPLRQLFEAPTIAGVAERIAALNWAAEATVTSAENREEGVI